MNYILCSDKNHPGWPHLERFAKKRGMVLTDDVSNEGGDFLFLVSCTRIIGKEIRDRFKHVLVIHESDLPKGRGWSPLAWQVLEGKTRIVISLLEAADRVDSGRIWAKFTLNLEGHELAHEIAKKAAIVKTTLIDLALNAEPKPFEQVGAATYYPRRTPEDSRLDPFRSIADQFDLLRVCEPRFPAFFDYRGHRYTVTVAKA